MRFLLGLCVFFSLSASAQVDFTESNLPIVVINTFGNSIPYDVKAPAQFGIIWNGDGQVNHLGDPYHYSGWIGIEKRGSSSLWVGSKFPYSIETRTTGGLEDLDTSFLNFPKEADWALIAPYSDKTLIRDMLTYEWAAEFMAWAPRTQPVELTINGEYQGVYVITEKIKRDNDRVNISKLNPEDISGDELTGGYIIKVDKCDGEGGCDGWYSPYPPYSSQSGQMTYLQYHYPKSDVITQEQRTYIQQYFNLFENALASDTFDNNPGGYAQYVDLQSFADFFLINELTRNVDGYRISTYLHKEKDSNGGKLRMGPVWDFNIALGNADYCNGQLTEGWAYQFNNVCGEDGFQVPFWWERLLQDDHFKVLVRQRWSELRQGIWSNGMLNQRINEHEVQLFEPAERNFTQWPIHGQYIWPNPYFGNSLTEDINYLQEWLMGRVAWLDGQFSNFPTQVDTTPRPKSLLPFPNPSTGVVNFYRPGNSEYQVQIFDLSGKLVGELDGQKRTSWTAPETGLYVYRIKSRYGDPESGIIIIH